MNMNSFAGKRILALIRDGDYAHAGEEEAIDLTLRAVPKRSDNWLLDVGCGRGGSADYARRRGWGRVVGIDREADSIEYGRRQYPQVEFHVCDVVDVARLAGRRFDVIYMLNAFYAFRAQREALASLRSVASPAATLFIFDYLDRGGFRANPLTVDAQIILPHAIELSRTSADLGSSGWKLTASEELNDEYRRWYAAFVARIDRKHNAIVALGGDDAFRYVHAVYSGMLAKIEAGLLGGVLLSAVAA
ncbi:MAG TPA: class I SAM-dependent methyltransferase [Candidatus Binataceae bacterium]